MKAGDVQVVSTPTAEQGLLATIYLHVGWHSLTKQLTTPQKEMFADAVDAHFAWMSVTDRWDPPAGPVDRWWRDA